MLCEILRKSLSVIGFYVIKLLKSYIVNCVLQFADNQLTLN